MALELRETLWLPVAFRRESDRRGNFFSGRVREWGVGFAGAVLVWELLAHKRGIQICAMDP